jgi:hypothetical protein
VSLKLLARYSGGAGLTGKPCRTEELESNRHVPEMIRKTGE